jgi:hypothetical protein
MIFSALAACCAFAAPPVQDTTVNLGQVYTKGEKLAYKVRSHMQAESRNLPLRTWIPEDLDISYDFTLSVLQMKSDGIAVVRYQRPTMSITEGETFTSPPKTTVEKPNLDVQLTISPINELLDMKDLSKPSKTTKAMIANPSKPQAQMPFIGQFISEMYRMTLFVGSLDSSLDFMPKLRTSQVKVGDTWQKTFAYQPQKLKGKNGKTVVQRIDLNYVYKGAMTVNGKKIQRVEASYNLDTDLSQFVNDSFGVTSAETGLSKLPMKLKANVEFDLDPVTHHCLEARADSEGGFEIYAESGPEGVPVSESKLKGHTVLMLAGRKIVK